MGIGRPVGRERLPIVEGPEPLGKPRAVLWLGGKVMEFDFLSKIY